jgi:hypothetical protein
LKMFVIGDDCGVVGLKGYATTCTGWNMKGCFVARPLSSDVCDSASVNAKKDADWTCLQSAYLA